MDRGDCVADGVKSHASAKAKIFLEIISRPHSLGSESSREALLFSLSSSLILLLISLIA